MIFASIELAARVERAECRLLTDGAEATRRRRASGNGDSVDVCVVPMAGGVATHVGNESPLNKVAGLGFAGEVDETEWDAVERIWTDRRTPVQVEVSCLADPSVGAMLTRRGYILHGYENVLGCMPKVRVPDLQPAADIEVRPAGAEKISDWLSTVVTGFMTPDMQGVPSHEEFPRGAIEGAVSDLAAAAGVTCFLAWRHGQIAGGASMKISDGVAQMCGAATLPDHRRRGVQRALLEARLTAAADAGCDLATVTALPGSKSHENVQKRGFELLYTRAVLVGDAGVR